MYFRFSNDSKKLIIFCIENFLFLMSGLWHLIGIIMLSAYFCCRCYCNYANGFSTQQTFLFHVFLCFNSTNFFLYKWENICRLSENIMTFSAWFVTPSIIWIQSQHFIIKMWEICNFHNCNGNSSAMKGFLFVAVYVVIMVFGFFIGNIEMQHEKIIILARGEKHDIMTLNTAIILTKRFFS